MKKNVWTKMLSLALALVCVIGLVACGGNGGSSAAAGTYKLQTISMSGLTMDMEQLAEASGISADDIKVTLELKSDGSFLLDMSSMADSTGSEDNSMEGTWKESGSNIELEADGATTTATLQDGVITLDEDGTSMTFKK